MNRKILYITIFCAYIMSVLASCSDDDSFSTSPYNQLTFEVDTLSLDTVFSTVPSPHKQFLVHNKSNDGIRIVNARLENGNQTGFRINVCGTYLSEKLGYQVHDLELRKGDSLRVFVELTSANNLKTLPQLLSDNLIFTLESGVQQKVNLKAWSWDAFILRNLIVNNDTTISNLHGKPVVVYDSITVKENATLNIAAGTTIYFHHNAGIRVEGTLKLLGEQGNEITLRCDRLDRMVSNLTYDNNPGQWGGIRILPSSFDNTMTYTDLHGACTAFRCDSSVNATRPKLSIANSTIHNLKGSGVWAENCNISIENSQISNAIDSCLFFRGGNININNCTVVQYYPFDANRGPALAFANAKTNIYMPLTMYIKNSIIKGYEDDVIYWSRGTLDSTLNVRIENSLLRTPKPLTKDSLMFVNCIYENTNDTMTSGRNSFVMFDTDNFFYDFTPKSSSQAVKSANPATSLPFDRNGKPRNVKFPDMGCFETPKEN